VFAMAISSICPSRLGTTVGANRRDSGARAIEAVPILVMNGALRRHTQCATPNIPATHPGVEIDETVVRRLCFRRVRRGRGGNPAISASHHAVLEGLGIDLVARQPGFAIAEFDIGIAGRRAALVSVRPDHVPEVDLGMTGVDLVQRTQKQDR
jgi:hypothetical protein